MAELEARTACEGLELPLRLGGAVLSALEDVPMVSVAPFRGREGDAARVLAEHAGGGLPGPGAVRACEGGLVIWSGAGQYFLRGEAAGRGTLLAALGGMAAVTDQGSAWTGLHLGGAGAAEVLARLVPVDLDRGVFPPGSVARTMLGHMICVLTAEEDGFGIGVMRSFTLTAVHEIEAAMRRVAGIAALRG